jgi:hypothetical protein
VKTHKVARHETRCSNYKLYAIPFERCSRGGRIKGAGRGRMAAADMEAVCRWMWALCYPGDEQLAQGLTDALAEAALTRIAAPSAAAVLRDIRAAVAAAPVRTHKLRRGDGQASKLNHVSSGTQHC